MTQVILVFGPRIRKHRRILVCADKDSDSVEELRSQVQRVCGVDAAVTVLRRGRIKG